MRTIRTAKRREIVLDAISRGLTVAEAAAQAGISRRAVFDWKEADAEFARDYEQAYAAGTDCYEAEARRRAFDESDALLIFLLKARDPQKFARRLVAIGGDADAPPVLTAETAMIYPRPELQREDHLLTVDVPMLGAEEAGDDEGREDEAA
jgi:hypothetical protein